MSGRIDVSDYLLGELSAGERAEAERLMREDPSFRAEVERLRPVVERLSEMPAEGWESLDPPPLRLTERDLAPAPRGGRAPSTATAGDAGVDRPAPPAARRRRLGFLREGFTLRPAFAGLAAAALLAVGVGAGLALDSGGGGASGGREVALQPIGTVDAGATGTATFAASTTSGPEDAGGPQAVIELRGMRPSPPGTYYEMWLMNSASDLVSLGSFRVPTSGKATITVPLPEDPGRYHYFDISVERNDGDPGHSGVSVMRAPA
ncbi:MAG: anti-sigma factor [Solirubrobacterales bacterium]